MIPIGERINGSFADVRAAILAKDKRHVQDLALMQQKAGAAYLDCHVGAAVVDEAGAMRWLVEAVQEATDTPLSIDSRKLEVIKAGLQAVRNPNGSVINSCTGDEAQLDIYIPLALENNASLVARTLTRDGVPRNADERVSIAATIVTKAMEYGLPAERLFVDPVLMPVNLYGVQEQPRYALSALHQIRALAHPDIHMICGLSNISQGTRERPLMNRTFLAMAVEAGLDAAIVDVLDAELMDAWITAEVLMNRQVYSDSYLRAVRLAGSGARSGPENDEPESAT
jgi:5-methyltetrahydrofolate corrinoid/iron sulfur protein methyltransferase